MLQPLPSLFVGANLLGDLVAIGRIKLVDELWDEVLVVERLLHAGQCWTRLLALARVCAISIGVVGVGADFIFNLLPQALQIEGAQGIWTETAALVVLVAGDVGVVLQQVGDPAKDGVCYAIGAQTLEQKQRFEGGVGRAASIHPPVPVGVWGARRAMGGGRYGSQRDSGRRLRGAGGHRTARRRWARRDGELWGMESGVGSQSRLKS